MTGGTLETAALTAVRKHSRCYCTLYLVPDSVSMTASCIAFPGKIPRALKLTLLTRLSVGIKVCLSFWLPKMSLPGALLRNGPPAARGFEA